MGRQQYHLHTEMNVPLVESQSEMTPLQKNFLIYAEDYWGPDDNDVPNQATSHGMGNTEQTTDISEMKDWQ